jgi:hypothetical protein
MEMVAAKPAGLVLPALASALLLASALQAPAQEHRRYDAKIEKWVAKKISGKLGELRGTFALKEDLDAITVHETWSRPASPAKLPSPIYQIPRFGGPLPPIVMDHTYSRPDRKS